MDSWPPSHEHLARSASRASECRDRIGMLELASGNSCESELGCKMLPREAKCLPTNRLCMWKLTMKSSFLIAGAALLACALPNKFEATLLGADNPPTPQEPVQFFKEKVRPILTQNCYTCHTDTEMGHLRVDSREGLLKGGGRGPAIVPGDPEKSLLIQAVRQTGALKMPKGGKLTAAEIDGLVEWVKNGAVWAASAAPTSSAPSPSKPAVASASTDPATPAYVVTPEHRAFWSFQPIHAPQPPQVKGASWARTDTDRFVL